MKILHIENGRNFYGGPQQVLYLCSGLDQKGIKNLVICHPESFLLEHVCEQPTLSKHRTKITIGDCCWEVDEFHGTNKIGRAHV